MSTVRLRRLRREVMLSVGAIALLFRALLARSTLCFLIAPSPLISTASGLSPGTTHGPPDVFIRSNTDELETRLHQDGSLEAVEGLYRFGLSPAASFIGVAGVLALGWRRVHGEDRLKLIQRASSAKSTRSTDDSAKTSGPASGFSGLLANLNESNAAALLMVLAMGYAANVPILKSVEGLASVDLTSPEILALRFITAAVPWLPWLFSNFDAACAVARPGFELGLWLYLGYTFQILGLEKIPAASATVLFAFCGLMVQALQFIFDKKPISKATAGFTLASLFGLLLFESVPVQETETVVPQGWVAPSSGPPEWLSHFLKSLSPARAAPHTEILHGVPGEMLVLIGTFFFAMHVWRSAALMPKEEASKKNQLSGTTRGIALCALQLLAAAVLGTAAGFIDVAPEVNPINAIERLDTEIWIRIFASGLLGTSAPHFLELFALQVTEPAQAALIYCTIPVWGTLFSIALLGESLSPQAMVGGLVIILCSLPWATLFADDAKRGGGAAHTVSKAFPIESKLLRRKPPPPQIVRYAQKSKKVEEALLERSPAGLA